MFHRDAEGISSSIVIFRYIGRHLSGSWSRRNWLSSSWRAACELSGLGRSQ